MTCFSIGFIRDDSDFHVLATLNNNAGLIPAERFTAQVEATEAELQALLPDELILSWERQDAPDYVSPDDDETDKVFEALCAKKK